MPHILGDNMVIQQNSEANLWGWDKPGTEVKKCQSRDSATALSKISTRW
ncbi:hypothetical protein [Segatella hominis]